MVAHMISLLWGVNPRGVYAIVDAPLLESHRARIQPEELALRGTANLCALFGIGLWGLVVAVGIWFLIDIAADWLDWAGPIGAGIRAAARLWGAVIIVATVIWLIVLACAVINAIRGNAEKPSVMVVANYLSDGGKGSDVGGYYLNIDSAGNKLHLDSCDHAKMWSGRKKKEGGWIWFPSIEEAEESSGRKVLRCQDCFGRKPSLPYC